MLRCYLLALCSGSSLDKNTNNASLFNIVEHLHVPPMLLGQVIGVELHCYYFVSDDVAKHSKFEMRLIRTGTDGKDDVGGLLPFSIGEGKRARVSTQALRLPVAFDTYTLRIEWRMQGTEAWTEDPLRWPLIVENAEAFVRAGDEPEILEISSAP